MTDRRQDDEIGARRPPPTAVIIFGAAGDLTRRKLVPALFNLFLDKVLPEQFTLIGLDRVPLTDDELRRRLGEGIALFSKRLHRDDEWNAFASAVHYIQLDFTQPDGYARLAQQIQELDRQWGDHPTRIFYFAVPPSLFGTIAGQLGHAGLVQDRDRARVVVEKPLGYDLGSALSLNRLLLENFVEPQIFRIDHYLGKETVQNILAFRFATAMFEPIWDRRYVDHVTITVAEEGGVGHRGGYYDRAGALRDMVQNHLLQLLCLVTMEPPVSFRAEEVRNKKIDVLHAVRPIAHHDVHAVSARGQYGGGWVSGQKVPGYREEPGVDCDSATETFAALKLFIDNWRWQDVPFYLRTGKRLPRPASEISIRFRAAPHQAFPTDVTLDWQPARLIICIQPDEGILLRFQAKQPGRTMRLRPVAMRFSYTDTFKVPSPDAYETLLWDVMVNDPTLFMRADQVEAAWSILAPVLDVWAATPPNDFPNYDAGTWGPEQAEVLIAQDGRVWLAPARLNDSNPVQ
jgi:glucose-6-phosphate 1-dehydrogenase